MDNIEKYGLLSSDEKKAVNYKSAKIIFDKCHKAFIESSLSDFTLDWKELYECLQKQSGSAKTNKDTEKDFEKLKKQYYKKISDHFKNNANYNSLTPNEIIKSVCSDKKIFVDFTEEEMLVIKSFEKFSCYFSNYQKARENVYGPKDSCSVAYRIVDDNFIKFVRNIKLFELLDKETVYCFENELSNSNLLKDYSLNDIFSVEFYNKVLSQSGIDFYNSVLGGITQGGENIKGLNELCNFEYQKKNTSERIKFDLLFKQILSDRTSDIFTFESFSDDAQIIEEINKYSAILNDTVNNFGKDLECAFSNNNSDKIFIGKNQISFLPQILFDGEWNKITYLLSDNKIKKANFYNLAVLNKITDKNVSKCVFDYYANAVSDMEQAFKSYRDLNGSYENNKIQSYDCIKNYLDSVQKCEKILKIFSFSDEKEKMEMDYYFYSVFDAVYSVYRDNIPLYNKVRNYVSKNRIQMKSISLILKIQH